MNSPVAPRAPASGLDPGAESARIADQLRRALEGPAWHGPAILELLQGVDARTAAARFVANAHTIWEIVLHIAAWENAARRRIGGDSAILTDAEDWPTPPHPTDSAWAEAVDALRRGNQALRDAALSLDEAGLARLTPRGDITLWFLLHGVVQHDLYHAGQIALLKKSIPGA